MTLDQLMQYPVETRRAWTQHEAGLSHDGSTICLRCGIGLNPVLPVCQTVSTYQVRMYLGAVPEAPICPADMTQYGFYVLRLMAPK